MIQIATLTTKHVAGLLGVHVNTVRNWRKQGKIKAYKYGRSYRFYTSDIEKFAESRQVK